MTKNENKENKEKHWWSWKNAFIFLLVAYVIWVIAPWLILYISSLFSNKPIPGVRSGSTSKMLGPNNVTHVAAKGWPKPLTPMKKIWKSLTPMTKF